MRLRFSSSLCTTASLLGSLLMTNVAFAQDVAPPSPMQPMQPMQPTQPGQPTTQPGVAPPPPMQNQPTTGDPGVGETNQKLNEAESKDSGRNFELFWLDGQINGSYINLSQFSSDTFQIKKTSAGGPAFSVGAGVRFVILYLGARLRYNALSLFNLWQVNGEAGLKIPIGDLDIMFGLHGGYSFVGRLGDANQAGDTNTPSTTDAVQIRGFNGGLDVALDYYVSPLFSVGFGVMADFLFLNRPAAPVPDTTGLTAEQKTAIQNDPLYQKSGTSAGLQLGGGLRLGLHFGL